MTPLSRQIRWSRGFTLIEILVVVFLIGLISGFAVLSVNAKGDDREIEDQLRLLQYQLTMAGEESVVQGRPVGVQFEQGKYSFWIAGRTKWQELDDGRVFHTRELLRGWRFELQMGSESLLLLSSAEDADEESKALPQIIFYSSGEVDPFELLIVDKNNTPKYRIWYGDNGVIGLKSTDES